MGGGAGADHGSAAGLYINVFKISQTSSGRKRERKRLAKNPTKMAMLKLRSVPNRMYSPVIRFVLYLKIDFAAIRSPMAVYC